MCLRCPSPAFDTSQLPPAIADSHRSIAILAIIVALLTCYSHRLFYAISGAFGELKVEWETKLNWLTKILIIEILPFVAADLPNEPKTCGGIPRASSKACKRPTSASSASSSNACGAKRNKEQIQIDFSV